MTSKKTKIADFDSTKYLKSEDSIVEYLKASWEMSDPEVFLAALSAAAKARGMTELAQKAGVCRESLYRSLSPGGNPSFKTIFKIAVALGVSFEAMPESPHHTG